MLCGCTDTTPCGTPDCGCKFEVEAGCVRYTGESLGATDIVEGDTLDTILKTLNTKFEEYGPGDYIELEDEAAGENCTYGGIKIILRDGDDDTIKSTKYVCGVDATSTLDGSGTANTIAMWTPDGNSLGNSIITQSGTVATIGGTIKITGGSPAAGKYLKSDADGDGSWSTITESDITGFGAYVKTDGTTPLTANWNAGSFTITSNKIVSTIDATVNGLTVGKGAGSIATNTAFGLDTLQANTIGGNNTAVGSSALYANTTGIESVAVGRDSLKSNTSGSYNTTVGFGALYTSTTSQHNLAIGYKAGYFTTTNNNAFVGSLSGYTNSTGTGNSGLGYGTLYANTTGSNNVAVGLNALGANTTGSSNTFVGSSSGYNNTTGVANTAVGTYTLFDNTIGTGLTAIGTRSLQFNTSGNYNTAIGHTSLYANLTGGYNTGLGFDSLTDNTSGSYNTAVGHGSAHDNLTGVGNSAFGYSALNANRDTSKNSAFGYNGLGSHEVGEDNTVIGYNAGYVLLDGTTPNTGNTNNIFIGAQTRSAALTTSNEIVIGAYAIGNGDNTTTIGTTSTTAVYLHGNLNLKNTTAVSTGALTQNRSVPIVINGVTYQLLLSL